MKKIDKILNFFLLLIVGILTFNSLLTLIIIHWNFFSQKYIFSFTPSGINTYLSAYGEYKDLFAGTIATVAAYYGLHGMTVATDGNFQKIKQDRFSEWKNILEIRSLEIEKKDPFMKREFVRVRLNFYERLYEIDFKIDNKIVLESIFHPVFGELIQFFEEQNEMNINMGGVYKSNNDSYSFDSFRFLINGSVVTIYENFESDLKKLYLAKLSSDRTIDLALYQNSLNNYLKRS
ncbi:MAG TPA: hypothetical protein VK705_11560 [Ferruginibacter sp.]|jgi:hypothetical protein|nr:hypothetical protein [Ferruginibacter sp.]